MSKTYHVEVEATVRLETDVQADSMHEAVDEVKLECRKHGEMHFTYMAAVEKKEPKCTVR